VLAAIELRLAATSSQSARLFLRIGFRDTGLLGAGTCFAAIASFCWYPATARCGCRSRTRSCWAMGLGLLSVCVVVGPQSTVRWNQRGVVTGAIMFCRSLGQSLGAAIFGRSSTPPCRRSCGLLRRFAGTPAAPG